MSSFSWFDILVCGFILLLGLKGIINGLIKELFGLLGVVGGIILAFKYKDLAVNLIQNTFYRIENQALASAIGLVAILIVFWVFCLIVGNILSKLIKLSGLGFIDRLGGFIFSGAKVFLILAVLIYLISQMSFLNQALGKYINQSYALPYLQKVGAIIVNDPNIQSGLGSVKEDMQIPATDQEKK